MIFSRKYVFETKRTKTMRLIKSAIAGFILFLIAIVTIGLYIPIYGKKQIEASKQYFYQKEPDLIAVYTGDQGRLYKAFKLAQKFTSSKILISGVHAANSLKILVEEQGQGLSVEQFLEQNSHKMEIDYLANNTIENVTNTIAYLKRNPQMKNVLIISSDYHILRISYIVNKLNKENAFSFHYEAIKTNYSNTRSMKLILREIYKFIKIFGIFAFNLGLPLESEE
jgi:uncharacterized SAM-binding protein YcdF (DUF218 family)